MTGPMDHAEAHERLADLALEPGALQALRLEVRDAAAAADAAGAPDAAAAEPALLAHLRTCEACAAELGEAGRLDAGLELALTGSPTDTSLGPVEPPARLRAAVLAAARAEPRGAPGPRARRAAPGDANTRQRLPWLRPGWTAAWPSASWAATIAALVVVAVAGGLVGSAVGRAGGEGTTDSLVGAVTTVERVLEASDHRTAALRTPAGQAVGTVAWSHDDFAVLASTLQAPQDDQAYRCWLEWSGQAVVVGEMDFAGATAYWTGSLGSWADLAFEPGTRFLVTLEPAATPGPGARPTGPTILEADLGT